MAEEKWLKGYVKKYHWQAISFIAGLILYPVAGFFIDAWLTGELPKTETYFYQGVYSQDYTEETGQEVLIGSKCWSSISATRSDAFRCSIEDGTIHDPCFRKPISIDLLSCPSDPELPGYTLRAEVIEVSINNQKNDQENDQNNNYTEDHNGPWFIVLENRSRCRFLTGATYLEADLRASFSCDGDETLYGALNRNQDLWNIRCNNLERMRLEECSVSEVWF